MKVGPARVPCFLEFDIEAGSPRPSENPREVTLELKVTRRGRFVTEDGTVLASFDFSEG